MAQDVAQILEDPNNSYFAVDDRFDVSAKYSLINTVDQVPFRLGHLHWLLARGFRKVNGVSIMDEIHRRALVDNSDAETVTGDEGEQGTARTWAVPEEPKDVPEVLDRYGNRWRCDGDGFWSSESSHFAHGWAALLGIRGPLTDPNSSERN
jgi:hypothetical protein